MKATIGERGQVTIPKALRDSLGLRPGMDMEFTIERGKLVGRKWMAEDAVRSVMGCLGTGIDTDKLIKEMRGEL